MTFNAEQAACLCGCSQRQLRYWRDTGLIQPAHLEPGEHGMQLPKLGDQSSMTSIPCSRSCARWSSISRSTSGLCPCQSSTSPTTRSGSRVR